MKHITFGEDNNDEYPVVILIKESQLKSKPIYDNYISGLEKQGVPQDAVLGLSLWYDKKGKLPAKEGRAYLTTILKEIIEPFKTRVLLVADAQYFKWLTKVKKATDHYHQPVFCAIKGFETVLVVLTTPYSALFYDPSKKEQIEYAIQAVANFYSTNLFGSDSIIQEEYYYDDSNFQEGIEQLHTKDVLSCDIETSGLSVFDDRLLTISFSWSKTQGAAFSLSPYSIYAFGDFFRNWSGQLLFHNASFDITFLTYHLFMKHPRDYEGMKDGLNHLTKNIHDTMLLAYVSLNGANRPSLSLKQLASPYVGSYALEDMDDLSKYLIEDVLRYNLIDCLATFYLFEQYYPKMIEEQQEQVYKDVLLPSIKLICAMQLVGLPVDSRFLAGAEKSLQKDIAAAEDIINTFEPIKAVVKTLKLEHVVKRNQKLKTKQVGLEDAEDIEFNIRSTKHLRTLLFEIMELPVLDKTQTGLASTSSDTLKKLIHHCPSEEDKNVLKAINDFNEATKILNTFIMPFINKGIQYSDYIKTIHGNFRLGGTVSGRMSSNSPNLMNLPSSGTKYAKVFKDCVRAPKGWLFVGADFSSLEDRINALLSKDVNKIKVYTEGFDSHCLRAYYYFKDQMPDIDQATDDETVYKVTIDNKTHYLKSTDTVLNSNGDEVILSEYIKSKDE